MRRTLACALLLLAPAAGSAAEPVDFLRDVKPVLIKHCAGCHGVRKQQSGLRLDSGAAALAGGNSGPAVVPGKSAQSLLIQAVTGAGGVTAMPPDEPRLTAKQVALLKAWIDQGAKVPKGEAVAAPAAVKSDHWAFRAPVRAALPRVKDTAWVRNFIDHFVLARLEKEGLAPSPEADRATLIRRLSLDLTGLPPAPGEVDDFLADARPDAYERLVDRLLASPHHGERWGRHWLDAARYADSNGYNGDAARPMWRYRDWVIGALNADLPFDRFTVEQLAGDLLPGATLEQKIASGFHRNTTQNEEGGNDAEQYRNERVVDRVATTGAVWLGLTVGCAQCHDHKYDPVSQRDFYRLFAFFNNADEVTLEVAAPAEVARRDAIRAKLKGLQQELKAYDKELAERLPAWEKGLTPEARRKLKSPVAAVLALPPQKRTDQQQKLLLDAFLAQDAGRRERQAAVAALQKQEPRFPASLVMKEREQPRATHIQVRGDFLRKGALVDPGVPAVLPPLPGREGRPTRLDLANWLVDRRNPLTARVTVNRLWQHYFGTGLVETENDFGTRGAPPSHPELLDRLATELPERGWSFKAMHRLIVTSATYRQSSHHREDAAAKDSRNRLLARQGRLRLEAEAIRDSALVASGLLTRKLGGPSVFPPQPPGLDAFNRSKKNWKADAGPDRYRRGMYTHFWRSFPHPSLTVFDAPDSLTTCTRRTRSTTPQQALTLANDQAFLELAEGLADRVLREAASSDSQRLRHAFRLCLGRAPGDAEAGLLLNRLAQVRKRAGQERPAWLFVSRVLLNLDEFITRE